MKTLLTKLEQRDLLDPLRKFIELFDLNLAHKHNINTQVILTVITAYCEERLDRLETTIIDQFNQNCRVIVSAIEDLENFAKISIINVGIRIITTLFMVSSYLATPSDLAAARDSLKKEDGKGPYQIYSAADEYYIGSGIPKIKISPGTGPMAEEPTPQPIIFSFQTGPDDPVDYFYDEARQLAEQIAAASPGQTITVVFARNFDMKGLLRERGQGGIALSAGARYLKAIDFGGAILDFQLTYEQQRELKKNNSPIFAVHGEEEINLVVLINGEPPARVIKENVDGGTEIELYYSY